MLTDRRVGEIKREYVNAGHPMVIELIDDWRRLRNQIADAGKLAWTTERPTVPGWYWARGTFVETHCAEAIWCGGVLCWNLGCPPHAVATLDHFTHFAGPLPEPRG